MSPVGLQRIVVRMLYDPAFVEQIYSDAPLPELDASSRDLLTRVPRAAYGTDPYRRARSLTALLEEYPASAALVGVAALDAFFSSPVFHRAIQGRMSLALAFGGWLEPLAGPVARLERAIATTSRQRPHPLGGAPGLATSPDLHPLTVPGQTLATYEILRQRLGPEPLVTLARRPPSLAGLPPLEGEEHLLIERSATGELGVGTCDEGLLGLLVFGLRPRPHDAFVAEALRLGAEAEDAPSLIHGLVEDGLLVAVG